MTQPAPLPNFFQAIAAIGSQWTQTYQVTNDNGSLTDITNKTFELSIRDRNTGIQTVSVNNTSSTTLGTITVTSSTSSFQVMLTPAATDLLTEWGGNYTLWMDPNLPDATALVAGVFYGRTVTNP